MCIWIAHCICHIHFVHNFALITGGSDYRGSKFVVTFEPGDTTATALIHIIDDELHECFESFTLDLEIPEASMNLRVIKGSPDTARVNIQDDDG